MADKQQMIAEGLEGIRAATWLDLGNDRVVGLGIDASLKYSYVVGHYQIEGVQLVTASSILSRSNIKLSDELAGKKDEALKTGGYLLTVRGFENIKKLKAIGATIANEPQTAAARSPRNAADIAKAGPGQAGATPGL